EGQRLGLDEGDADRRIELPQPVGRRRPHHTAAHHRHVARVREERTLPGGVGTRMGEKGKGGKGDARLHSLFPPLTLSPFPCHHAFTSTTTRPTVSPRTIFSL